VSEQFNLERGEDDPPYPPYVVTEAERERWDLSEGIARLIFDDAGEAQVWQATRSIFRSDFPTDPPPPDSV